MQLYCSHKQPHECSFKFYPAVGLAYTQKPISVSSDKHSVLPVSIFECIFVFPVYLNSWLHGLYSATCETELLNLKKNCTPHLGLCLRHYFIIFLKTIKTTKTKNQSGPTRF